MTAYRISEEQATIEPLKWPALGRSKGQQPLATQTTSAVSVAARPPEVPAIDPAHLNRLQQAHQAELAQCRQLAFDEGFRKGREAASAELKTESDRLAQLMAELAGLKRRIRNDTEEELVKLSLAIAKRILHRELSADPESICGIVHAGLQKLGNREVSRVRVAPLSLDAVRSALAKAGVAGTVTVAADPRMKNGEIVFETVLGDLDASVDTQLREIERGFADKLGRS